MVEGKVSQWLEEAIKKVEQKGKEVIGFRVIIQTDPKKTEEIVATLKSMGIKVIDTIRNFIVVDLVEPPQLETVAKIPGVLYVSYERKFYPLAYGLDEFTKRLIIATDPILSKLTEDELWDLGIKTKPTAMMPSFPVRFAKTLADMTTLLTNPLGFLSKIKGTGLFGLPVLSDVEWALVTYTRELHELPPINECVIQNTKVGVIDSGVRYGPGFGFVKTKVMTALPSPPIDQLGHGCLRNVFVYTSRHGIIDIEELWDKTNGKVIKVKDGELKEFDGDVYTISKNGITKARGIFRTKSRKKIIIETAMGTIEATPWHKFLVGKPKRNNKTHDSHRRWYCGVELEWKRADEISPSNHRDYGDWLVMKAYDGESWGGGEDVLFAYLGGLIAGDGVIIVNGVNLKTGRRYTNKRGTRNEIMISDKDKDFLEKLSHMFGGKVHKYSSENAYYLDIGKKEIVINASKYVNPPINSIEHMRAWIAGFFDAEGYVHIRNSRADRIKIVNTNYELLDTIRKFLLSIGIPATIVSGGVSKGSKSWHLVILVPELFYKLVEPYVIKKKELLMKAHRSKNAYGKAIKYIDGLILVKIKAVYIVDSDEYFYDLADTDEGAYVASGFVVHNSWVHSCAFGNVSLSPYGRFIPVAYAPHSHHVKAFGAFGGITESQLLKAIDYLVSNGVKVINMSLGGPQTDPLDKDPVVRFINEIVREHNTVFIVAAGNSGPSEFTIESPGVSPDVITVSAMDWKTLDTASYSSRGPQGAYYEKNKDELDKLVEKFGEIVLKPDVIAIGGDEQTQVVAASAPWYDGYVDVVIDGWSPMCGTSMATPHVAGIVALLVDRGIIRTQLDFKKVMKSKAGEKTVDKGWGFVKCTNFT